ncbi:MAG: hypothetical protein ACREPK_03000 [Rhodanobacteraceae bacterium]
MNAGKRNLTLALAITLAAAVCSPSVRAMPPAAQAAGSITHFPAVSLSYDGQHLAWIAANAGKTELMLGSASSGNARAVNIPGDCTETGLRWARRWNKLAVMMHCADTTSAIWLLDVNANKPPREVAHFSGLAHGMRWTAGDKSVAFLYAPGDANQRVASVGVTGGAPDVLTPANLNVRAFDWSATGPQRFVYTVAPQNSNGGAATRLYTQWAEASAKPVLIVDTQTSNELRGQYLRLPRFALNGTRVYFLATQSSTAAAAGNLYRVPAKGGSLFNLTLGPAVKPSWFKVTGRGIVGTRRIGDSVEVVAYGHGSFVGCRGSSRPCAVFFSLPGTLTDGTEPLSVSLSWRHRPRIAFVQNSTGQPPIVRSGILSTQPPPAVLPNGADVADASTR